MIVGTSSLMRTVCEMVRLVMIGMPLMLEPARARISNSNCSVTSSFGCRVGVVFILTPMSSYSAPGYGVCAIDPDKFENKLAGLRITVTWPAVLGGLSVITTSGKAAPVRLADRMAVGFVPTG